VGARLFDGVSGRLLHEWLGDDTGVSIITSVSPEILQSYPKLKARSRNELTAVSLLMQECIFVRISTLSQE